MNKRIWLAASAVGLLVATTSMPSAAAGSDELSKQAKQAASIDELRSSDAQLTQAIATLDKEVGAQSASVASAQQAVQGHGRDRVLSAIGGRHGSCVIADRQ